MNHLKLMINRRHIRRLCTSAKPVNSAKKPNLNSSKELVPLKPIPSKINLDLLPPKTKIDGETIALLERLSLVDCANKEGIKTLEDAIEFADQILQVDTEGVEPLITVLEDRPLIIREDAVTDGNIKEQILSNASVTEEEYFVAPPGNIPLTPREDLLHEEPIKKLIQPKY